jgi:transposase InsO family protein
MDSMKLGELFIREVFKLHGLPDTMESDRGQLLVSEFWRHVCERLGIEWKMSTAFHPQTDSQTERMNAIIEQYPRVFVNNQQNNWASWLPIAECVSNNHTSEMTGYSLFCGNYGFHLRMTFSQHSVQNFNDIRETNTNILSQGMNEIFKQMKTEMS